MISLRIEPEPEPESEPEPYKAPASDRAWQGVCAVVLYEHEVYPRTAPYRLLTPGLD
jgi:hypothetical protein